MEIQNRNTRIAKNTLFLYVRMVFVLLISLYTTRIVLNSLGAEDFGIYNVVAGFVTMFGFINTSFSNGIQRFYNYIIGKEGYSGLKNVFNTAIVIQSIISFIIVLVLETLGRFYVQNELVIPPDRLGIALNLFHFSVISLVLLMMQIPFSASIMAHEKMDFYAVVSIVSAFLKLLIALILPIVTFDKLLMYGIFTLTVSICEFLLYYVYSKKHFVEINFDGSYQIKLLVSMLSFSGWNILGTFAFMLKAQGLTVLLNTFFGTIVNAAQGVASQIQNAIYGFSGNIVTAFRPQLVQSYAAGNFERVLTLFFSLSKISFFLLFMLSVPVAIELNYILRLWLGDSVPEYTESFTVLVLANMVLSSFHTPLTQIIHASGKMKKFQIITSIIMCMIIPISYFLLNIGYNPNCVYWVSLFIQFINQIVCMLVVKEVLYYSIKKYIFQVIFPCCVLCLVVPMVCYVPHFLLNESFYRLLLTCSISMISTILIVYFALASSTEKQIIRNFINHKLLK